MNDLRAVYAVAVEYFPLFSLRSPWRRCVLACDSLFARPYLSTWPRFVCCGFSSEAAVAAWSSIPKVAAAMAKNLAPLLYHAMGPVFHAPVPLIPHYCSNWSDLIVAKAAREALRDVE